MMDDYSVTRHLVVVSPQNLPEVYSPQTIVVRGVKSDGMLFNVDIGRVCYLEREDNSVHYSHSNNFTVKKVSPRSLSRERVKWLRNYLNFVFHLGWRDETLRTALGCVRSFFDFCDFSVGKSPITLDGLVKEYQRYLIELDQRVRINGAMSLKSSTISKRLFNARCFIQCAFELSNNDMLMLIPLYRSRILQKEAEFKLISLREGQDYLRACTIYFNQFSDAILRNDYPVYVTPPNSSRSDLYWHSTNGASLKSLPGCFYKNGDPLQYKEIKEIIAKNFKSKVKDKSAFYNKTLIRNRSNWKNGVNGKLIEQKAYAYNLSTFCFFQLYLGYTAANVQPTLDLKISDIDPSKIGSSVFARKHKFRSGRAVDFTAPSHLKIEIVKYLKLRKWAEKIGGAGIAGEYLFVSISTDKKLKRLSRGSGSSLIRKSLLFEGITKITSKDVRRLTGEYFIRKSQGKISLLAKKLNNSIATTARSYTGIDIESQAREMHRFNEELNIQIRQFNRTTQNPVAVKLGKEGQSERVATGSCGNIKGEIPLRARGFNYEVPEPSCGTFESCLFCEHFAVHEDFEDIHKLLSLRKALHLSSVIRNDSEHHKAVVQPALFRIEEIVDFLRKNKRIIKVINLVEEELEKGNYNKHWGIQIKILQDRINNLVRER
jgi:hypothetical protein